MPDGIYDRPGRALLDGDRFLVVGPPAGPGGVSAVELPDGSVWQVDHSDPATPVLLELDAIDAPTSPLLVASFGGDGALFLADDAVPMTDNDLEDRTAGNRPAPGPYRTRRRQFVNQPAWEAGHAVLLADLGNDTRMHPLARVAACLEFATSFDHTEAGTVLRPMLSDLLDIAEQLADDVDDHELASLDPLTVDGLRSVCLRARKVGHRLDLTLRTLLRRLDHVTPTEPDIAVHALRTADRGLDLAEDEPLVAAAYDAPPQRPEPGFREVQRTDDAVVRVTVERSDTQRWVRVLHRRGLVLLGQAPLRRDGLLDTADIVVPADTTDDDLEIQVLEPEELAVLVDRPVDAIRRAINAGREASRSDRLGDRATAQHRWEHCATLWMAAGDNQRGEHARDLAETPSMHPHAWPLVTDSIAEVLEPLA